ncbi:putative armadillo-like helical protein [Helianthus annuus]|nr:putative armadillo-like helical protein [Helianthus annuus]KAJ0712790.1 putative armadillo-like helical protein [Helianthus annuus]
METVTLVEHQYTATTWKVHHLACLEVKNIMEKITRIFTALESARPRCKSGLQLLCSLHKYMERCKLLLRYCSESSKLYLAISGEKIIVRCERIRYSLELCLSQLQNMVEPTLALQISQIVDYIKSVAFILDTSEDEAGRVLLALLHQDIKASKFAKTEELKAFKFAASRLHITSPLALVIEKRSIRKLLSKICDTDPVKKKILNYLLYLVKKYGNPTKLQQTEGVEGDDDGGDVFDSLEMPMRFKNRHLSALSSASLVPSFNSSLGDLNLQVDDISIMSSDAGTEDGFDEVQEKSTGFKCDPILDNGPNLFILGNLSVLPWASRRKAIEDVKAHLEDDQESHLFISTSYVKPVFKFLKEADRKGDSVAKRHGAELLLMFLKESRSDRPPLLKDVMSDLSLFLDSDITEEALQILELLSFHHHYTSEIVTSGILLTVIKLIKNPKSKQHNVIMALRVLCNLSAHMDLGHHMIYLGFIQDLVTFLDDLLLSSYCIKVFKNLCAIEEAADQFHINCITSIGELLELGKDEEQEDAAEILLSLYCQREELRGILLQENIVSNLVSINGNGSSKGRLLAGELLQLLNNGADDCLQAFNLSDTSQSTNGNFKTCSKSSDTSQSTSGKVKTCSKSTGFFGRLKSKFRKFVW